jgi:hypothetical protein
VIAQNARGAYVERSGDDFQSEEAMKLPPAGWRWRLRAFLQRERQELERPFETSRYTI